MRLQSNVDLTDIKLEGTGKAQAVGLEVTVDGKAAGALGVMSQGELNSLALSLFLPRASLPVSPFGFVIVDDPVQAMDPARVEGLARVLQETREAPPGRRVHARRSAARGRQPPADRGRDGRGHAPRQLGRRGPHQARARRRATSRTRAR